MEALVRSQISESHCQYRGDWFCSSAEGVFGIRAVDSSGGLGEASRVDVVDDNPDILKRLLGQNSKDSLQM